MKTKKRFSSRATARLAMCGLALIGCGGSLPPPKYPFTDPARALSLQSLTRERVQAIRAEARIDQRGKDGRIKGTVLMLVERPASVRFDAMTQFGPAAVLTSNGEQFAYADLRSKRFLTGPTCPANIARMLNVPLSVQQTTLLLLGGTPVIAHDRATIRWHDDGFYRIELASAQDRQEVDLGIRAGDSQHPPERQELMLLRSEIYDANGKTRWRASYGDYQRVQFGSYGIEMPYEVRVEQPSAGNDTLIKFKEIALNVEIQDDAFIQAALPGMTEEILSCD